MKKKLLYLSVALLALPCSNLLAADLDVNGNFSASGSNNRLPNQGSLANGTAGHIVTRVRGDERYMRQVSGWPEFISSYLQITTASATYLTISTAATTYVPKAGPLNVGSTNTVTGTSAHAVGSNLSATGAHQLVIGRFNKEYSPSTTTWLPADPLFVIGKGDDTNNRSNAMVVLKNGNAGIGTDTPQYKLDVQGDVRVKNGAILTQPQGDLSMGTYVSGPQP